MGHVKKSTLAAIKLFYEKHLPDEFYKHETNNNWNECAVNVRRLAYWAKKDEIQRESGKWIDPCDIEKRKNSKIREIKFETEQDYEILL